VNYDLVAWDSVTDVILSWIYSPVLSAFLGAVGYYLFRAGIMRQENAPAIIIKAFPVLLFLCYGALFNMIMFKNSELFGWDLKGEREGNEGAFAGITTAISAGAAGLTFLPLYPKLKAIAAQADEPAHDAAVVPSGAQAEVELAAARVGAGPLKNIFLRDNFRELREMREKKIVPRNYPNGTFNLFFPSSNLIASYFVSLGPVWQLKKKNTASPRISRRPQALALS
jgi:phosphate/sulfate permease